MPQKELPVGRLGQSLARVLARRVKACPLGNTAVAAHAGVSVSHLRRIVLGERPVNTDQLDLLAAVLKTTPLELLAEADAEASDRPRDITTYPTTDDLLERPF